MCDKIIAVDVVVVVVFGAAAFDEGGKGDGYVMMVQPYLFAGNGLQVCIYGAPLKRRVNTFSGIFSGTGIL